MLAPVGVLREALALADRLNRRLVHLLLGIWLRRQLGGNATHQVPRLHAFRHAVSVYLFVSARSEEVCGDGHTAVPVPPRLLGGFNRDLVEGRLGLLNRHRLRLFVSDLDRVQKRLGRRQSVSPCRDPRHLVGLLVQILVHSLLSRCKSHRARLFSRTDWHKGGGRARLKHHWLDGVRVPYDRFFSLLIFGGCDGRRVPDSNFVTEGFSTGDVGQTLLIRILHLRLTVVDRCLRPQPDVILCFLDGLSRIHRADI